MKILITGGSGRIGYEFFEYLSKEGHTTICTCLKHEINGHKARKLDLTDKGKTLNFIIKEKPELVVHTAALTNVELCEKNKSLADLQNVGATRNIIEGCIKTGSRLTFISSSFVFSGRKSLYVEDDPTDPINYYGVTKAESERQILESGLEFLTLRVDQPYDWIRPWQQDNQVTRVLKRLESGEVYEDPTDWYNNPTFIPNIVEVAMRLVERCKIGVYNVVGPDYISRYNWSLAIADVFGEDKSLIRPVSSKKLDLVTKRPNANLSNKKAVADSGMALFGIRKGLERMKDNSAMK